MLLDTALIMELLKEVRDSQKEANEKLAAMDKRIVGNDKCDTIHHGIELRLRSIEMICSTLMVEKEHNVDGEELLLAKNDAIQAGKVDRDALESRLKAIEDKIKPFELTWSTVKSNPVLLTAFMGGATILAGVVFGRGMELTEMYGIHAVVVGSVIVLIAILSAWYTRHKAKKALKSMGVINVV